MIVDGHVRGDGGEGVAVRPQDLLAGAVERDGRLDLLATADDAAVDEVAHRPGLGRGEGLRAAVGERGLRARRAAAAAPAVVVVAVEVGADGGRAGIGLAVLAPGTIRGAGQ